MGIFVQIPCLETGNLSERNCIAMKDPFRMA